MFDLCSEWKWKGNLELMPACKAAWTSVLSWNPTLLGHGQLFFASAARLSNFQESHATDLFCEPIYRV